MDISNNSEMLRYMSHSQVDSDSDLDDFDVLEKETFESLGQSQPPSSTSTVVDDEIVNSLAAASSSEPTRTTEQLNEESTMSQNVSTLSIGSDDVSFDLRKVVEENQILKGEVEALNAKLREVGTQFESLGKKISQSHEEKKKLEQCSLSLSQVTEQNEALKTHIESVKMQIVDLENQLQAARHELHVQAQKMSEVETARSESIENQFRFKDEQLEQTKKQLNEIVELYHLEQNQTIDLKEKLRAAECKPLSSSGDGQLFSFSVDDVLKLQQDLAECKAALMRQNSFTLEKDEQIQIIRAQLESSQLALEERQNLLTAKDREHHTYLTQIMTEKQEELIKVDKLLADRESGCNQLASELAEKENANVSLLVQITERDGALKEMSLAKEKCEEICGKYQEKIRDLNSEVKELKQIVEGQEDHHLRALRDEVRQFKLAAHELDRENTTLKTQIAALSTENESISHWKAQCETYHMDYLQVLSQRDALDAQIAELNKAIEDLREEDKKKKDELEELHTTHIRFAQEHINSQETRSNASSTTSAKGRGMHGNEGGDKNEDIVSHVISKLKRGVSLLWDGENEPVSTTSAVSSVSSSNSNQPNTNPTAPPPPTTDPQPSSLSGGSATAGCSTSSLPPCPVCGKIFYNYTTLVEHCENCGENGSMLSSPLSSYGQHLDPFVFVPNQ